MIDKIINEIFNNFDFSYIFSVNLITYFAIRITEDIINKKQITILIKRIILVFAIVIMSIVNILLGCNDYLKLLNSAIFAPVFWSWFLKPIFDKVGIGYKQFK